MKAKQYLVYFLLIFISCSQNENLYENETMINEIENVILSIIELDSIKAHYPNYLIVEELPKYINLKNGTPFISGPPPNTDLLSPNLNEEFTSVPNISLTKEDSTFFNKQLEHSKRLTLSDEHFGSRKSKYNWQTEKTYIYFTTPIFNKNKNIAWIKVGLTCGSLCGNQRTLILKKQNSHWIIINDKMDWIS